MFTTTDYTYEFAFQIPNEVTHCSRHQKTNAHFRTNKIVIICSRRWANKVLSLINPAGPATHIIITTLPAARKILSLLLMIQDTSPRPDISLSKMIHLDWWASCDTNKHCKMRETLSVKDAMVLFCDIIIITILFTNLDRKKQRLHSRVECVNCKRLNYLWQNDIYFERVLKWSRTDYDDIVIWDGPLELRPPPPPARRTPQCPAGRWTHNPPRHRTIIM